MVFATVAQSITSTNAKMEDYAHPSAVTELVKTTWGCVCANLNITDLLILQLYAHLAQIKLA